jgi:hypothetical protein
VLAETQKETPFLKRLIGRKEMEEQFAACDEELNNSLKLFSVRPSLPTWIGFKLRLFQLSVQLSTMKLVLETTDQLRKQNEDLASQNQQLLLLCSPRPQNQPSPSLVEQTLSACFSGTVRPSLSLCQIVSDPSTLPFSPRLLQTGLWMRGWQFRCPCQAQPVLVST